MNGRFGRADYVPVHYVKRRLGEDEVKALYVAADVALIASVREGVNLWAMEYVACQAARQDDSPPGVLVYSEFAGCASSFSGGALIVNPYDAEGAARRGNQTSGVPRRRRDASVAASTPSTRRLPRDRVGSMAWRLTG